MKEHLYEMHLRSPARLLTPLTELLEQEEGVVISMGQVDEKTDKQSKKHHKHRLEGGMQSRELVVYHLYKMSGSASSTRLARPMTRAGFAAGTTFSALSRAKNLGHVTHDKKNDNWSITSDGHVVARKVESVLDKK